LLTMNSYGDIRTGMTIEEAARRLHVAAPTPGAVGCDYAQIGGASFMLDGLKIVRIEVASQRVVTPSGIHVGDSIAKLKKIYGARLSDEPQFYSNDPSDRTLIVVSRDGKDAMRFEANAKTGVSEIYAGFESAIHCVEGCA